MPFHRSITRINNTDNKYNVINVCCCILLCYIIISIIVSNQGVNRITIFFSITGTTVCTCFICIRLSERELDIERERERERQEISFDNDLIITAYPVPNNYTEHITLEAVICQPEDSL